MKKIKIFLGILLLLSVSRFLPHPPNFTSLIALSFYIPAILGTRYLPFVILSFAITDFIIGYHSLTHWTWGSVFIIGLSSKLLSKTNLSRILGSLTGACIFYLITNFGVWTLGSYGYTPSGLIASYVFALPFFYNSLLSTFIFSIIIEIVYKIYNKNNLRFEKFFK